MHGFNDNRRKPKLYMFLKGTDGNLLMLEISISRNLITFFEVDRPLFALVQSEPMARQGEEDVCKGRRKRVYV